MSTPDPARPEGGERRIPEIHIKRRKGGGYYAKCPRGLWEVSGPTVGVVMREALHYWRSYAEGGEYDTIPRLLGRPASDEGAG